MNKEKLVEVMVTAMPYPNQIKDFNFTDDDKGISFTWREDVFHVNENLNVLHKDVDGLLCGDNKAILLEQLLKIKHLSTV